VLGRVLFAKIFYVYMSLPFRPELNVMHSCGLLVCRPSEVGERSANLPTAETSKHRYARQATILSLS